MPPPPPPSTYLCLPGTDPTQAILCSKLGWAWRTRKGERHETACRGPVPVLCVAPCGLHLFLAMVPSLCIAVPPALVWPGKAPQKCSNLPPKTISLRECSQESRLKFAPTESKDIQPLRNPPHLWVPTPPFAAKRHRYEPTRSVGQQFWGFYLINSLSCPPKP